MNLHTLLFYTCLTKEVLIALDTPSRGLFSAFLSRANGHCFVSLPFSHRLTPPSLQVANQCEEGFTIDQAGIANRGFSSNLTFIEEAHREHGMEAFFAVHDTLFVNGQGLRKVLLRNTRFSSFASRFGLERDRPGRPILSHNSHLPPVIRCRIGSRLGRPRTPKSSH
eukprot:m.192114 g.192114  ORF g.192114 m.192114 type:complete len:167 (+) comp15161_c0_seq2:517-1017(+)